MTCSGVTHPQQAPAPFWQTGYLAVNKGETDDSAGVRTVGISDGEGRADAPHGA